MPASARPINAAFRVSPIVPPQFPTVGPIHFGVSVGVQPRRRWINDGLMVVSVCDVIEDYGVGAQSTNAADDPAAASKVSKSQSG